MDRNRTIVLVAIYHNQNVPGGKPMQHRRQSTLPAFVKVDMRSRSPRLWSWSIHHDAVDMVLMRSDELFRCAEDAWKAGQVALMNYEMPDAAKRHLVDTE